MYNFARYSCDLQVLRASTAYFWSHVHLERVEWLFSAHKI